MDDVLLYLIKKGALKNNISITTRELGEALGMTQQNASYRLLLLERNGYIKRQGKLITVGELGKEEARKTYSILRNAFDKTKNVFTGFIRNGLGEGRYYLSIPPYKNSITRIVGFIPYEGTLNVEVREKDLWRKDYMISNSIEIPSFNFQGRTLGGAKVFFPCFINKKRCAAIFPYRTHHKNNIIEFISDVCLRETLGKKEGDSVQITLVE
ncbi:MAG: DUF120 domain-containing protein [Candidatus Bilamarchaeaceae archaeon]